MKARLAVATAMLLTIALPAYSAGPATKVASVDGATVTILKSAPRILKVEANGQVPTGGWKKGRLQKPHPIIVPGDGIYPLDFVADKPTGIVNQMVTPITASPYTWNKYPADLKGVRISAATNCVIVLRPGVDKSTINAGSCKVM